MKPLLHLTSVLAAAGAMALAAHAGQLVWSGNVDDRATVTLHGRNVRTNTVITPHGVNPDGFLGFSQPTHCYPSAI